MKWTRFNSPKSPKVYTIVKSDTYRGETRILSVKNVIVEESYSKTLGLVLNDREKNIKNIKVNASKKVRSQNWIESALHYADKALQESINFDKKFIKIYNYLSKEGYNRTYDHFYNTHVTSKGFLDKRVYKRTLHILNKIKEYQS